MLLSGAKSDQTILCSFSREGGATLGAGGSHSRIGQDSEKSAEPWIFKSGVRSNRAEIGTERVVCKRAGHKPQRRDRYPRGTAPEQVITLEAQAI